MQSPLLLPHPWRRSQRRQRWMKRHGAARGCATVGEPAGGGRRKALVRGMAMERLWMLGGCRFGKHDETNSSGATELYMECCRFQTIDNLFFSPLIHDMVMSC